MGQLEVRNREEIRKFIGASWKARDSTSRTLPQGRIIYHQNKCSRQIWRNHDGRFCLWSALLSEPARCEIRGSGSARLKVGGGCTRLQSQLRLHDLCTRRSTSLFLVVQAAMDVIDSILSAPAESTEQHWGGEGLASGPRNSTNAIDGGDRHANGSLGRLGILSHGSLEAITREAVEHESNYEKVRGNDSVCGHCLSSVSPPRSPCMCV